MKFYYFVIIAIFSGISIKAQSTDCNLSLSGRVTDLLDEEPLAYATIYIKESQVATVCDANGKFNFTNLCAGYFTLLISHVGCETDTVFLEFTNSQFREFRLNHQEEALSEIIVNEQFNSYRGTLTVDYIEGKALESISGKSLGAALKGVTGVNSIQTGSSISKPVIHGLHSNRILIINNGVRQEGQQWGNEHGPEIDPFIANKFTVIKGAAAVKFGSDAMGGVIIVDAADMPDTAGVSAVFQTVGISNTQGGAIAGMIQGKPKSLNPFSWRLQGSLKKEGFVKSPNYYLVNTAYNESNYSLTTAYHKNNFSSELYYSYFHTKIGIFAASHIGNLTDLETAFAADTPLITGGFAYTLGRPYQLISHYLVKSKSTYHDDKLGNFILTAAWQNNFRSEFDNRLIIDDSIAALNLPSLYFEIGTITADVEWQHHKVNNFSGSVGVSGINQQNVTRYSTFIPNFKNYAGGVFVLEKYELQKWTLEAGLRYDYKWMQAFYYDDNVLQTPEHNFSNVSWNLGTTYFNKKHTSFNLNFSSAWRAPAISELYSDGLHHGSASLEYGDPTLKTERSLQGIFGLAYETEKTFLEVGIYNNFMRNFIYLQPALPPELTIRGAFPVFYYKQTDANIYGFDASLHYQILTPVLIEIKTSLLRARDLINNKWVVMMPADKISGEVNYKFKDFGKFYDLNTSVTVSHVFKQTRSYADEDYVAAPEAYTLMGLSIGSDIQFKKTTLAWSIEAENLFNVAYRDYLNRFRYFADDMGRNITLRIKIPIII